LLPYSSLQPGIRFSVDPGTLPNRPSNSKSKHEFVLPEPILSGMRVPLGVLWRVLFNIRYHGTSHIPKTGGLIVAANHQTYIDPFWIGVPIKRPLRFLAWDAAFNWPLVGKFLGLFGAWPLQIEGSDPAAIRRTLQWLRAGGAVVIFPEGGRARSHGTLDRFKRGAVSLALEACVPILPVTIRGGNRVWPMGQHVPRLGDVEITYHPLFQVEQRPDEETRKCARRETERLAEIIHSAL